MNRKNSHLCLCALEHLIEFLTRKKVKVLDTVNREETLSVLLKPSAKTFCKKLSATSVVTVATAIQ